MMTEFRMIRFSLTWRVSDFQSRPGAPGLKGVQLGPRLVPISERTTSMRRIFDLRLPSLRATVPVAECS